MKKSLPIKKTANGKINYVQKWVNRKIIFMYFFQLITNFIVLSVGFSGTRIFLHCTENTAEKNEQTKYYKKLLTGSLLKKTSEVCVKINHLFFQDVHPIPPTHHEIHIVQ